MRTGISRVASDLAHAVARAFCRVAGKCRATLVAGAEELGANVQARIRAVQPGWALAVVGTACPDAPFALFSARLDGPATSGTWIAFLVTFHGAVATLLDATTARAGLACKAAFGSRTRDAFVALTHWRTGM